MPRFPIPPFSGRRAAAFGLLAAAAGLAGCGGGGDAPGKDAPRRGANAARGLGRLPGIGDYERLLPGDGAVPGLRMAGSPRSWSDGKADQYLAADELNRYRAYGLAGLTTAEYVYGPEARPLTIEALAMRRPLGAAGAFHWTRHATLRDEGEPLLGVDAPGAVIDERRSVGNIYLYKHNVFFKILYHGPRPAPDLTPVARALAALVREVGRPMRAFDWMAVPGVDLRTAAVTTGPALGDDALPPSAWARAPGVGAQAVVYVLEFDARAKADEAVKAHRRATRARSNGGETTTDQGRRPVWWGTTTGRRRPYIATARGNAMIVVAGADSNRAGGALLDRIAARIE